MMNIKVLNNTGKMRLMTDDDLEMVLGWRNHPDVRRYMYTQHEISFAEHVGWFARASQDSSRHLLIYESESMPLGYVNIHRIGPGGIAEWGFYTAPDAPKGTGRKLGYAVLSHVFLKLELHKLCGQSLNYNEGSIRYHKSLGFQLEGILRQQHFDGQQYHDVICFGLLASEWQTNN